MERRDRMQLFAKKAEKVLNFGGGFVGEQQFYGGNRNIGANQFFAQQPQNVQVGGLPDSDRTLNVIITNTGISTADAVLFDALGSGVQPAGITITIPNSSHDIVRNDLRSNPFLLAGMRIRTLTAPQMNEIWKIEEITPTGGATSNIFVPLTYDSAQNQRATAVDASTFQLPVTGRTKITIPVQAGESVTIIMTLRSRGNVGNILKGSASLDLSQTYAPTGLAPIDIAQNRQGF